MKMQAFAIYDRFQLNTIQRLTETVSHFFILNFYFSVPIKHYPTINWNKPTYEKNQKPTYEFQLNTIQRLTETPVRFLSRICKSFVPIKHYPTINWNTVSGTNVQNQTRSN